MSAVMQMTSEDVIQKLMQYGFKDCTQDVKSQCEIDCLYIFERVDDESGVCYGCETVDDLFDLLTLVETSVIAH